MAKWKILLALLLYFILGYILFVHPKYINHESNLYTLIFVLITYPISFHLLMGNKWEDFFILLGLSLLGFSLTNFFLIFDDRKHIPILVFLFTIIFSLTIIFLYKRNDSLRLRYGYWILVGTTCIAIFSFVTILNRGNVNESIVKYNFQDLDGRPFKFEDTSVKFIEYYASWCKPCISKMNTISNLPENFPEHNFYLINLSLTEEHPFEVAGKFSSTYPNYTQILDFDSSLIFKLSRGAIPVTIIVNKENKIIFIDKGFEKRKNYMKLYSDILKDNI